MCYKFKKENDGFTEWYSMWVNLGKGMSRNMSKIQGSVWYMIPINKFFWPPKELLPKPIVSSHITRSQVAKIFWQNTLHFCGKWSHKNMTNFLKNTHNSHNTACTWDWYIGYLFQVILQPDLCSIFVSFAACKVCYRELCSNRHKMYYTISSSLCKTC